jgi:hypothetical protein
MKSFWYILLVVLVGCKSNQDLINQKKDINILEVRRALMTPKIDGIANESIWNHTSWQPLEERWIGEPYDETDFKGRFKLTWNRKALFLLVEIADDMLIDQYPNPLERWWDDDCVEIFIDEDNSGGEHQFNHNAFAYHVALDGNVVDMSPEKVGKLYNNHVQSKHITRGNTTTWEMKISIFDDSYNERSNNNPAKLYAGKRIGFALAYCDNDNSTERENFIGSIAVEGEDKNRGWIDANIFGTLLLNN